MDVAAHIIVTGRVQGVGYRYFVIDHATSLGLTGWVRNLQDGTVEVRAEGNRSIVESLIEVLKVGPRAASVKDLQIEWEKPSYEAKGFNLKW